MRASAVLVLSAAIVLLTATNKSPSFTGSSLVNAQVSVPGKFPVHFAGSFYPFDPKNSDHVHDLQRTPPTIQLPLVNNAQLLKEENDARDAMFQQTGVHDGSYQFGKATPVNRFDSGISTLESGRWISLAQLQRHQGGRQHPDQLYKDTMMDQDSDVMVWQLEIYSKSALSLNLIFSDFQLPENAEFYVSGKRHVLGAFTAQINNKPDGVFATAPIAGDRVLLSYYTTRGMLREKMPRIQLSHVIHGYKPTLLAASSDMTSSGLRLQDGSVVPRSRRRRGGAAATAAAAAQMRNRFRDQSHADVLLDSWLTSSMSMPTSESPDGDLEEEEGSDVGIMSGKCNIDIACHQKEYRDQSRSVGILLSDYNQKYCTGALINNVNQDGRQLFLTAAHCTKFPDTSAHIVMFNHEKLLCGAGPGEVNEHDTAQGLVKLGTYADSDYTLYEIVEPIPDSYNLYLSGWSAQPQAPSSQPAHHPSSTTTGQEGDPEFAPTPQIPIVGIHHPSGDSKKISFFHNGTLPKACWSECDSKEKFHWKIPRWDEGTTEPGSSGSPLFNTDKRIIGQLHGGSASCWNKEGYDMYGALHASFQQPPKVKNRLATYLDPDSTGTKFMDGVSLVKARQSGAQQSHYRKVLMTMMEEKMYEEQKEDPLPVEPLGRPELEKPRFVSDDRQVPCQQRKQEQESRQRFKVDASHRTPSWMFDRFDDALHQLWGRLFQGYGSGLEEDQEEEGL
ncbi:hypothetical protein BGZ72_004106 [Mortierella alpina]|nr:hypothetical protein BGZ72_004106 [Mortierella alpina]